MPLRKRPLAVIAILVLVSALTAAPALKHFRTEARDFPQMSSQLLLTGAQGDSLSLAEKGLKISMDGHPATGITVKPFSQAEQGSSILVCVDASGSISKAQFTSIRAALEQATDAIPANTSIAIALFANEFETICEFTADKARLKAAIGSIGTRPGNTYLHFSLEKALKYLTESKSPGAGSILLISDGKEEVKFDVMTDDDIAAMVKLANTNGIPIHTIGYSREKNPDFNLLDYFSSRTGGILQRVTDSTQLPGYVGAALGSSGKKYTVSYKICGLAGDGKNHTLRFTAVVGGDSLSTEAETGIPNNGKMCSASGAGGILKRFMLPIIVGVAAILAVVIFLVLRKRRKATAQADDSQQELPDYSALVQDEPAKQDVFRATGDYVYPSKPDAAKAPEEASFAPDFRDRTVILGPGGVPMEPTWEPEPPTELPPPEPETDQIMRFTLLKLDILAGPDAGRVFAIDTGGATIGRGESNGVVFSDSQTSRTHARIYYQNNQFHIQDMQSRNGTIVNSVRVTDHVIQHNDTFTIGQNSGNFYLA